MILTLMLLLVTLLLKDISTSQINLQLEPASLENGQTLQEGIMVLFTSSLEASIDSLGLPMAQMRPYTLLQVHIQEMCTDGFILQW